MSRPATTRPTDKPYTVTQLADELGVTPRAIRFYEDKGLIAPDRAGSTRVYTYRDRARMTLILRGKRLGFSLRDIRAFLQLYDTDPTQAAQRRWLLKAVRRRLEELDQQRLALEQTIDELREIETQTAAALDAKPISNRKRAAATATAPGDML